MPVAAVVVMVAPVTVVMVMVPSVVVMPAPRPVMMVMVAPVTVMMVMAPMYVGRASLGRECLRGGWHQRRGLRRAGCRREKAAGERQRRCEPSEALLQRGSVHESNLLSAEPTPLQLD